VFGPHPAAARDKAAVESGGAASTARTSAAVWVLPAPRKAVRTSAKTTFTSVNLPRVKIERTVKKKATHKGKKNR
jgi:hypothetical protein